MKYTLVLSKLEAALLGLLSGILMFLSFPNDIPGFFFSPLAFVALVPLFMVLLSQRISRSVIALAVFVPSFYYIFLMWMSYFDKELGVDFPVVVPATILGVWLFYYIAYRVYRKLAVTYPAFKVIALPLVFTCMEFTRGIGYLKFPYGSLAYSQWNNLYFIQTADLIGYIGISFIMYCITALLADFMLLYVFNRNRLPYISGTSSWFKNRFVVIAGIFILMYSYGTFRMNQEPSTKTVKASMVQMWFDFNRPTNPENKEVIYNKLTKLSYEARLEKPDMVIWPETAILDYYDHFLHRKGRRADYIRRFGTFFSNYSADRHETWFLAGTLGLKKVNTVRVNRQYTNVAPSKMKHTKTQGVGKQARKVKYNYYNSAFLFNTAGSVTDRYSKTYLVPFAEWFPYGDVFFLSWLKKILDNANASSFSPGEKLTIFSHPRGFKFSTLICYEDCFDDICRLMAKLGSEVLVVITNDAWSYSDSSEINHYIFSVFRAIENRKSVLRSANAGVTCYIDPRGRTVSQLPLFTEDVLTADVEINEELTFYSDFGPFYIYLFLLIVLTAFIASFFLRGRSVEFGSRKTEETE